MENTLDRRSATDSVERADHLELDEVVEFATFIRERPVTCHWFDGEVTGDPELLERLSRMAVPDGWTDPWIVGWQCMQPWLKAYRDIEG